MLIAWNVCFCVEKQLTIYDASTRYSGNILGVVDQGVVLTAKSSSLSELNQSINQSTKTLIHVDKPQQDKVKWIHMLKWIFKNKVYSDKQ